MRGGLTDPRLADALAEIERRLDKCAATPVAVAFSGGGDSRALLRLVAIWARAHGRPVLALTVDHGLHPASRAWTAAAGVVAVAEGARWRALTWDGPKPSAGLPRAARDARHGLLAEAARDGGARVLLLGHTGDDRREADHMRGDEARAIGRLQPWGPSPAWPQGRGVFLLRPLLHIARRDLRAWLVAQGCVDWLEDPANEDLRFARARARLVLSDAEPVPPPPHLDVEGPTPDGAEAAIGRLVWSRDALRRLDEPVLRRWLSCAVVCAGGGVRRPSAASLEHLIDAVRKGGDGVLTVARARVEIDASSVAITREANDLRGGEPGLTLAPDREAIWDGRWSVTAAASGSRVGFAGGRLARFDRIVRRRINAIAPAARRALPALLDARGEIHAFTPFGNAPGVAFCLVAARFAHATGAIASERDLAPQNHARALNHTSGTTAESTIMANA